MTEIEKQFAVAFAQTDDERAMLLHLEDDPADIVCRLILADSFEERGEEIVAKYQRQLTRIEELDPILDREPDNLYVRKIRGSMLLKESTQWDDHYRWEGLYYLWTVENKKYPDFGYMDMNLWDWWGIGLTQDAKTVSNMLNISINHCLDGSIYALLGTMVADGEDTESIARYPTRIQAEDDLRRVLVDLGEIK